MLSFAPQKQTAQFTATVSGGGAGAGFVAESSAGAYAWHDTGAAVNGGWWDLVANAGGWTLRLVNDASTVTTDVMKVTRTGMTVGRVSFSGRDLLVSGDAGSGYGGQLILQNIASGATAGNKFLRVSNVGTLETVNSAGSAILTSLSDAGAFSVQQNYIESSLPTATGDTRIMLRGGVGSPTKSCSINFTTAGVDAQGYFSIQRRALAGDTFEAVMFGVGLSTGNTTIAGALTVNNSVTATGAVTGTAPTGDFGSGATVGVLAQNSGGSNGAVMGFLRAGGYGIKMGLDAGNLFAIGGWSSATRVYWDTAGNQYNTGSVTAGGNLYGRDFYASRGDGTGVIYLNAAASRYLYYDGTQYQLVSASLYVGGGVYANNVLLSSSRDLKNVVGALPGEAAFHRVMSWLPKLYSRKDEASPRVRAGLILDEMPPEITDRDGHIDLYAALTELAAAFQFLAKKVTGERSGH